MCFWRCRTEYFLVVASVAVVVILLNRLVTLIDYPLWKSDITTNLTRFGVISFGWCDRVAKPESNKSMCLSWDV